MKCIFTLEELKIVFPIKYPDNLILTNSTLDAISETEPFRGVLWPAITSEMLNEYFEAPYFFSREAMYYFLPAYLKCTMNGINEMILPLDCLFSVMSAKVTDNPQILNWKQARWKQLSNEQWKVITKWLAWIKTSPESEFFSHLMSLLITIENGIWNNNQ